MKPNRVAGIAALLLAIAGLSALLASGILATRQYTVTVKGRHFRCGSVLVPHDPRNSVSSKATLPQAYQRAYRVCLNTSSSRIHTATTFLVIGVIPLLIVLMLPSLTRRSRRAARRR